MASELKPCAHCYGAAELDYEQPFCAFPSGKMEKQVAIYCTECDVHMSMCYSDFPEYDHDQMAAILTDKWNTRPAPAATDAGLETVAYRYRDTWEGARKYWKFFERHLDLEDAEIQALCLRSEAEELLAAERAKSLFLKTAMETAQTHCGLKDKTIASLEADNAALTARVKEETKRADNTQARLTAMSKTILRMRDVLILVTDNIDDEGDRYYFGSTNDADQVKDITEELDGWTWDDIISDGKLPDVYETSRNAIKRAKALETQLAAAEKERDHWKEYSSGQGKLIESGVFVKNDEYVRLIALEAKLAAAEKALEFYADASKWDDGYFKSEDDGTVLRAYPSSVDKDQGDKARAVLGGKPS